MRVAIFTCAVSLSLSVQARVDTLWIHSDYMDIDIGTTVILPEGYDVESVTEYPVVYILHGAGGDYGNWLRRLPQLEDLSTDYGFIFVFPDGGRTSWYLDSPIDSQMQYESYIIEELTVQIDKEYRTSTDLVKRAITGLSMGGHGALYLALKNPNKFRIAGSMSGGVDLRPFPENWDLPLRLGEYNKFPHNWEDHSVVVIAEKADPNLYTFIIDCGTEDFFLDVNRALDSTLNQRGFEYHYEEREGAHNWHYWRESIMRQLEFFDKEFSNQN